MIPICFSPILTKLNQIILLKNQFMYCESWFKNHNFEKSSQFHCQGRKAGRKTWSITFDLMSTSSHARSLSLTRWRDAASILLIFWCVLSLRDLEVLRPPFSALMTNEDAVCCCLVSSLPPKPRRLIRLMGRFRVETLIKHLAYLLL